LRGKYTSSKSGLFLIELIISIAFFAVSSAICVQLFAQAHTLSSKSGDINMAVTSAQSAAEYFKASAASLSLEELAALMDATSSGDSILVYYGENWERLPAPDSARFTMTMTLDMKDALAVADIRIDDSQGGVPLYQLTAKKYIA